jgi:hydroxylysine kinase
MLIKLDEAQPENAGDLLASSPPTFSCDDIAKIAAASFGVAGSAVQLTSERDQNFLLINPDGDDYVIKVTNAAENPSVTDLQTKALLHIAAVDPLLPVPRVRLTTDGASQAIVADQLGRPLTVRMLSYLKGEPLHKAPRSITQLQNLGACLAALGIALRSFFHPAAGHQLQWDIKNADGLWDLLDFIREPERQKLARDFLHRFTTRVSPRMRHLRAQIIHNDMNPYNVMVGERDPDQIAGIFDFGDMVHTALINDLAVCASYNINAGDDPLGGVVATIRAYNAIVPLEPVEIELLYDLIAARLVTTVAITSWRAERYPENRSYILRNAPSAWLGLECLTTIGPERVHGQFLNACKENFNGNG